MCRANWLFAIVVALVAIASPAWADPAVPTHFRSTILEVDGDPDAVSGVEVEVLGGDAFLMVRALPGRTIDVPGYDDDPYLRYSADGTVEVNVRSPARWLNDARYGAAQVAVPPEADSEAPPVWEVVATEGVYAWHDHRVHFMSPTLPPSVDRSADEPQQVLDWEVPLRVDGADAVIVGRLDWLPGPPPAIGLGAVLLAVASGFGLGWRRPSAVLWATMLGVAVTGGSVAVTTFGQVPGHDVDPRLVVLPALAVLVLAIGLVWSRRDTGQARWLVAASAVPLGVWAVLQGAVLTRPIAAGGAPVELVRAIVVLVSGMVAVAAGSVATALGPAREPTAG